MFFKSLQRKLVFIITAISLVIVFSIIAVLYLSVQSKFYDVFKNSIEEKGMAELISHLNEIGKLPPDSKELKDIMDNKNGAAIYFSITNQYRSYAILNVETEEILAATKGTTDQQSLRDELFKSTNFLSVYSGDKASGSEDTNVKIGKDTFYDYAVSMTCTDGKYVLYFRDNVREWQDVMDSFNKIVIYAACIAVLSSAFLGYILARTITVPIENIMKKAKSIANNNFDNLLEVKSDDEIGKLTDTFNIMAIELKNRLLEISSEKNKIETILDFMNDGVIAFNKVGAVVHSNPAAKKMLRRRGRLESFRAFSNEFDLGTSIEDIMDEKNSELKETCITVRDKFYGINYAVVTNNEQKVEGIIVVIQDITEQQKLDNMRREFVANVSHELKTPLTSIKSYAETIIENFCTDEDSVEKRFLGVINSEADRMSRLVRDLLQLSSFDNEKVTWNFKYASIGNLIDGVVEKVRIEIENKKHKINCSISKKVPYIYMDEDRIEQVLINIISNAIKYTPEGGLIEISIEKKDKDILMIFRDTGIGIPEEDIERIFERFYRVDKARSREMGGTGLGLSIAKEIIDYHGGKVDVESEVEKGTKIIISLPIKHVIQI